MPSSQRRFLGAAAALSLLLAGCDSDTGDVEDGGFRCVAGVPSGLVGLDLVDMSGTPTVSGEAASVFSNVLVSLAGSYDLEGSAISGGAVTISGNQKPGGDIVENATKVSVADPTADVVAAKTKNDNAKIPCVASGNKCLSPVSSFKLSLASKQSLTLAAGSYYFESISISGQAKLNVSGDVVIYLAGGATFNGGSATNPSSDSLVVISSSTSEIKLNGGGTTDMHIFAPNATVRFAGTQGFKGTALGKELRISGTADLEVSERLDIVDAYTSCDSEPDEPFDPETRPLPPPPSGG
jgi:hypothetical protein